MGADSPPTKIFFVLVTIWNKNYNNIRNKAINKYLSRMWSKTVNISTQLLNGAKVQIVGNVKIIGDEVKERATGGRNV